MATKASARKLDGMYEGLTQLERVRMLARLGREHQTAEIDRLRRATPAEHADAYNRALGLLRVLNGSMPGWVATFHIGMERDRFRLQYANATAATRWLTQDWATFHFWGLISYPVTESEYRRLVELARATPANVWDYAERVFERDREGLPPELRELIREYDEAEEPSEEERPAFWDGYAARFVALVKAAIKRGELPKPRPLPRDSRELELPEGALSDWTKGTTPETYKLIGPSFSVPVLGELFQGDYDADWEIRPDSETEAVTARRAKMREAFMALLLAAKGLEREERVPSFDPPATLEERSRMRERSEELSDEWRGGRDMAELAVSVAKTHASFRTQLEDLIAAVEIVQREDFGGEDPLWSEVRKVLDDAQGEARRFDETWEGTQATLREAIREVMGLEAYPKGNITEPAPLPIGEHDVAYMVRFLREWGE